MADVAAATGDAELFAVCERMFDSIVQKRMYITGGCGSTPIQEQFSRRLEPAERYLLCGELRDNGSGPLRPPDAGIHRTRQIRRRHGTGPLQRRTERNQPSGRPVLLRQSARGGCKHPLSTIPPVQNGSRGSTAPAARPATAVFCRSLGTSPSRCGRESSGLTFRSAGLYRFSGGELEIGGQYPYGGTIPITIRRGGAFRLALRIPGWCREFQLLLNGSPTEVKPAEGYVTLEREWLDGRPAGTLSGDAGRGRPRQLACHLRCRKDRLDAGGRSSMRWRVSTTATEFRG